ncbi:MAG: alanine racemase [Deltaproteobacteria bacterium CG2_30_63_29]|nr:MAG: alanine racemase [Deltaproteobacteria bacterium CG2_30_63_29]PIV98235.1 MAG: alanine racemase [Deltaproteobacteria bacterium CG17_big_fil_post_rev_8_21_14_2_50_63_7]PJB42749.1 MAG: alanine racemase [Deltaproteobacteria bacterium CG_4_9_14_3_um_filter_63_12]
MTELRRTWCEVDVDALGQNLRALRALTSPPTLVAPVIKSNAYGHGLLLAAHAFVGAGADWFCVDSVHELEELRQAGFSLPILVLGHVPPAHAPALVEYQGRAVVYDAEVVDAISAAALLRGAVVPLHIKIETGTHRQGLTLDEALQLGDRIERSAGVKLEGLSTHFANVEDTTDHSFARRQLSVFEVALERFAANRQETLLSSICNSAGSLLWPHAHHGLIRPGIATYGLWPSKETYLSAMLVGRHELALRPALTWKTQIAQVKSVTAGAAVGYGCSFRATTETRLAILPVGYYDGYDRGLSNLAHVLVHGQRAPLRGRVCMNMTMVDVTHIPAAKMGDEVVLLGVQGEERVSAEQLAEWASTINYEITTRIHESIPRIARRSSLV